MKKWAYIDDGRVSDVISLRPDQTPGVDVYPPSWTFIEVTSKPDVKIGWLYDGSGFSPPAVPDTGEVPSRILYKADIYRRATDAEADAIELALMAATTKRRRLFECAQSLDPQDEAFSMMEEAMTEMFGAKRASELLAAS